MIRRGEVGRLRVPVTMPAVFVAVCVALAGARAASAQVYARPAREAHLDAALAALRALGERGRAELELELHAGVRAQCRPGVRAPATGCMIDVARGVCARRSDPAACAAAADVILTNQHAETDLVDEPTRIRLVRTSADYHAAVLGELRARFALLAAELALAEADRSDPGPPPSQDRGLAARIDRFCAERDRIARPCPPGARACVGSLAWQRCAAGLAWFVVGLVGREGAR